MNLSDLKLRYKSAVPSFINTGIDDAKWYDVILYYLFKITPIITGVFGMTAAVFSAFKLRYDTPFILAFAFLCVSAVTLLSIRTLPTLLISSVPFLGAMFIVKEYFLSNISYIKNAAYFLNDYYIYLVQTVGFDSKNTPSKAVAAVLSNPELLQIYSNMAAVLLVLLFSLLISLISFKIPLPFLYLTLSIAALAPLLYFGIQSSQFSIYMVSISIFCTYADKIYLGWYNKSSADLQEDSPIQLAKAEIKSGTTLAQKMNGRKKLIMGIVLDGKITFTAFLISFAAILLINFYYMSGVEKTNFNSVFSNVVNVVTRNINKDDIGNAFGVGNDIGQGKINENGQDLSNSKLIKIFPSDKDNIYLRTWAGANYSNDRWTSLNTDKTNEFKSMVEQGINPQNLLRNYLWVTKGINISKNYKYSFDKNLGLSFIKIGIGYIDIRTGLLCLPPMYVSNSLESDNKLEWGYTGDGILSFKRRFLEQPSYFVDTIIPKYNADGFKNTFLNKQKDYEKIAATVNKTMDTAAENSGDTNYNLVKNELLYRDFVYENYLAVPDNMKDELTALAKQIVGGSKTTFDKAEKIRVYLAENYQYNLKPPNNQKLDAIHYFLFESKQGFCSHYASSMSLLLRTLGIPTRYSTGYVVQTKDYEDYTPVLGLTVDNINDRTGITVYPRYAHAWCEVYFDGIGWLPFEATTSISNPMYIEPSQFEEAPQQEFEYDTEEEFEEETPQIIPEGIDVAAGHKINYILLLEIFALVAAAVALLVLIRIFINFILAKYNAGIRREMFGQYDKREAVNDIFEYIIIITQKHISKINPGELLRDYAKRIDIAMGNKEVKLASIIPISEKSAFSKHEITEADRTAAILYARYLRDYVLEKNKRFDSFVLKNFDSDINF